jgi:hypothetical protein
MTRHTSPAARKSESIDARIPAAPAPDLAVAAALPTASRCCCIIEGNAIWLVMPALPALGYNCDSALWRAESSCIREGRGVQAAVGRKKENSMNLHLSGNLSFMLLMLLLLLMLLML